MPNLAVPTNLIAALLPALFVGGATLLHLAWRERFFSYYFAYASASGRWSAPGRDYRL